jgi:hypothetical protein
MARRSFAAGNPGLEHGAGGNTAPEGRLPALPALGCRCCWRGGGGSWKGGTATPAGAEPGQNRLGKQGSNATQAGEPQASETFCTCPVGMRKLCQGPGPCSNSEQPQRKKFECIRFIVVGVSLAGLSVAKPVGRAGSNVLLSKSADPSGQQRCAMPVSAKPRHGAHASSTGRGCRHRVGTGPLPALCILFPR